MKVGGYEWHYKSIAPPTEGLQKEGAQLTPLSRNKSKLPFNCDHCGLAFEKYACWAKRTKHHYCSKACTGAAKIIRIPKSCIVCNSEMLLTPTDFPRISTCSKVCSRKRKTVNNSNLRTSPDYLGIAKRLKKNMLCQACGTTSGPWIAKGIRTWVDNGLSYADGSNAYLVCRPCHLKSVLPLALESTYMQDRAKFYEGKNDDQE